MMLECELVKDVSLDCELETGGAEVKTQSKTVTPTASPQTVYPDSGYYLSSVHLTEPLSQEKTVISAVNQQTVTPDEGYLLSSVTVDGMPTETANITPTEQTQTVTPSEGKLLSEVTVDPIPSAYKNTSDADVTAEDITQGKIGYGANGKIIGTSTAIVPAGTIQITQNGTVDVSQYAEANINVPEIIHGSQMNLVAVDVYYTGDDYDSIHYQNFIQALNLLAAAALGLSVEYVLAVGFSALDTVPDGGYIQAAMGFNRYTQYRCVGYYLSGATVIREQQQYVQNMAHKVETNSHWRVYCFV